MTDLLALSASIIDDGAEEFPVRITQELSELSDDIAVIESFSNVVILSTDDGLVLSDTSGAHTGAAVVASLREWSGDPVHSILYTHGHIDHVGGAAAFVADAEAHDHRRPRFVAQENLPARFQRYQMTSGYNTVINHRQFGGANQMTIGGNQSFLPEGTPEPDLIFSDRMGLSVGELQLELRHAKGETDDHAWAWIPEHQTILPGDFFIWNFPNAGNPQKVQRYPREWAAALREMAGLGAELFVPAHGLPIGGAERIRRVLDDTATALEYIVERTLEMMNAGARLDDILHTVKLPKETLEKPWLRPRYDEPEFIVRNVWRMYGGWYDGNPARLKPAPDAALATELVALGGGIAAFVERARKLAEQGAGSGDSLEMRLACHLIEMAVQADPESKDAHAARSEIYANRRKGELSLMSKGIYGWASRESQSES